MVPGEILVAAGEIVLNEGRDPVAIMVAMAVTALVRLVA